MATGSSRWRGWVLALAAAFASAAVALYAVWASGWLEAHRGRGLWREVTSATLGLAGLATLALSGRLRARLLPALWPRVALGGAAVGGAVVLSLAASPLGASLSGSVGLDGAALLAAALLLAVLAGYHAPVEQRVRREYLPLRALAGFVCASAASASAARDVGFRGDPALEGALAMWAVALGVYLASRRAVVARAVFKRAAAVAALVAAGALLLRARFEANEELAVLAAALGAALMLAGSATALFADVSRLVAVSALAAATAGSFLGHLVAARLGSPAATVTMLALAAVFGAMTTRGGWTAVAALMALVVGAFGGQLDARGGDVLYRGEGRAVAVEVRRRGSAIELRVDRVTVARRDGAGCDRESALSALLALMVSDAPRRVAVLGGSLPDALRLLSRVPGVEHLDLVEPEQPLAEAARRFSPEPLERRYAHVRSRPRAALAAHPAAYDLIVGEVREPRDRAAIPAMLGALRPGGTVSLVVPVGADTADTVVALASTFHDARAFSISPGALVVIARRDARTQLSIAQITQTLAVPAVGAMGRAAGVTRPDEVAALYVLGPQRVGALQRGSTVRGLRSLLGTAAAQAALDEDLLDPGDRKTLFAGAAVRQVDLVEQGLLPPWRAQAAVRAAESVLTPADRARLDARLKRADGQLAEARRVLEEAARLAPEDLGLARDLGQLFEAMGLPAEARGPLGRAFARSGGREDRVAFARVLVAEGDPTARRHLDALRADDPADPRPLLLLGRLDALEGRDDDAERSLLEYLRLAPDDADAHFDLASLYRRRGRTVEARDQFLLGGRAADRVQRALAAEAERHLAEGEPRVAVQLLRRAIAEGRLAPALYRTLALAYARAGRKLEAQKALDQYVERTGGATEARAFGEELRREVRGEE